MKHSDSQQPSLQSVLTAASTDLFSAAKHHKKQVLCSDVEGWGPISNNRWDLTPCALDLGILAVAAFGLLGGISAVFYLLKKKTPQDVKKNWHYYTKL